MYRSHKKFLSLVTILITTPMSKIDSGVYFSLYFPRERRFSRAFLRQLLEGPLPSFQPSSCSILPTTSAPGGAPFGLARNDRFGMRLNAIIVSRLWPYAPEEVPPALFFSTTRPSGNQVADAADADVSSRPS